MYIYRYIDRFFSTPETVHNRRKINTIKKKVTYT